jgi:hypothetical protein
MIILWRNVLHKKQPEGWCMHAQTAVEKKVHASFTTIPVSRIGVSDVPSLMYPVFMTCLRLSAEMNITQCQWQCWLKKCVFQPCMVKATERSLGTLLGANVGYKHFNSQWMSDWSSLVYPTLCRVAKTDFFDHAFLPPCWNWLFDNASFQPCWNLLFFGYANFQPCWKWLLLQVTLIHCHTVTPKILKMQKNELFFEQIFL